jgi:hypothetical protein
VLIVNSTPDNAFNVAASSNNDKLGKESRLRLGTAQYWPPIYPSWHLLLLPISVSFGLGQNFEDVMTSQLQWAWFTPQQGHWLPSGTN